jgi:hypothetical protein
MMAKGKKKGNKITVDMSDVEARFLAPEDDYRVKAVGATREEGNEHDYIAWEFEIQKGEHKGKKLRDNTSLSPAALFRLRGLLEAGKMEVPDSEMDIDLDTICDELEEFMVTVFHDEYEPGKTSAKISDYFPVGGEKGEDDDDDKKTTKKKKKPAKDEDDDDKKGGDDDELPDEDAVNDMDEDELTELVDEHDLDVDLDDHKKLSAKRNAVWEAIEAKGDGGEDDDDKRKGSKRKGSKKKSWTADDIDAMGTAELKAVIEEAEIEVELTGTTKSKRRAVKKALKSEDMLEE